MAKCAEARGASPASGAAHRRAAAPPWRPAAGAPRRCRPAPVRRRRATGARNASTLASKGLGRGACRCAAPGRGCPGAARLRIVYFGAPNAGVRGLERPFSGLKSSFSLALGAPHGCGQPPLPGELGQIPPNAASKEV